MGAYLPPMRGKHPSRSQPLKAAGRASGHSRRLVPGRDVPVAQRRYSTVTLALGEPERARIVHLYETGLSIADISELTGPSTTWIRRLLSQHGVVRSRSDAVALSWQRRQSAASIMAAWRRNRLTIGALIDRWDREVLPASPADRVRRGDAPTAGVQRSDLDVNSITDQPPAMITS